MGEGEGDRGWGGGEGENQWQEAFLADGQLKWNVISGNARARGPLAVVLGASGVCAGGSRFCVAGWMGWIGSLSWAHDGTVRGGAGEPGPLHDDG